MPGATRDVDCRKNAEKRKDAQLPELPQQDKPVASLRNANLLYTLDALTDGAALLPFD